MQQPPCSDELSVCPSFNSYSSGQLADVAARISHEFSTERGVNAERESDDFEFVTFRTNTDETVMIADDVFSGGRIRPIFPVFNRDLLLETETEPTIRIPLKKLFLDEGEAPPPLPSSSSSEEDELEGIPAGTYCVWTPRSPTASPCESSPGRCKKSNSTGSSPPPSKKWRFRDLLRRSNSDNKDSFVFLTPKNTEQHKDRDERAKKGSHSKGKSSPHEAFYVRNKALREGEKRKSYLPYRQDLVGFFAGVSRSPRSLKPF